MTEASKPPEYKVATPPYIPVLRPRRHIYFDTVRLQGTHQEALFSNIMSFPNGEYKQRDIDTNMNLCGQLGTPLLFDLWAWSIAFEKFGTGSDIREVLASTSFKLVFGYRDHTIHSAVGTEFYPAIMLTDGLSGGTVGLEKVTRKRRADNWKKAAGQIRGSLRSMAKRGQITHWYQELAVDRKAIRIDSTEGFKVDIVSSAKKLSCPVQFKVGLHGILYTP